MKIFENLPGVTVIVDGILIYCHTREEHYRICAKFLKELKKRACFNPDKMKIGVKDLPFFGHLVTDEVLKLDELRLRRY